ncbi:helix-turn-helix transcriptional regulator [Streptomyces sp. NPDC018019]|uniref:helix-turn-helix transcriptional regulator n=1 Tax=Streptomyces sp. NPDC018019 TaxID=3365030 RepID=UPI00379BAF68
MVTNYANPSVFRPVEFSTTDPEMCRTYFLAAYGAQLRVNAFSPDGRIRHRRCDAGTFAVDDLQLSADVSYRTGPRRPLVITEVKGAGGFVEHTVGADSEHFGPGDLLLASQPDEPYSGHLYNVQLRAVPIAPELLTATAVPAPGSAARPLRFTGLRPANAALAAQWKRTMAFIADDLLVRPEAADEPLLVGSAARLLAAATLAAFPNTLTYGRAAEGPTELCAAPTAVRRAVAFIEGRPDADIGLTEIAAAACVSPRALQHAFRRHLGTTPTGYLRRVRLAHAHEDLVKAEPSSGATVAAIAYRWGFAHQGRFAARYRSAYGCSPLHTLRGT